jgi:diguanylate cyclase (GGDEF)-like protein
VVRWGGEEFVVWLPGLDGLRAQAVAEKLRLAVAEAPPRLTVSAGMAELRVGESLHDAIDRADRAMYAAKQGGRNRVAASEALPT